MKLFLIVQKGLAMNRLPEGWGKASIFPILKADKKIQGNKTVPLMSGKVMEQTILETISKINKKVISSSQNGLLEGEAWLTTRSPSTVLSLRCLARWMRGEWWMLLTLPLSRLLTLSSITSSQSDELWTVEQMVSRCVESWLNPVFEVLWSVT